MYFDGNIVDDAAAAIGFSQTISAQGRAFRPRTSFKLTQLGVIDLTIKNLAYHQYWSSPLRAHCGLLRTALAAPADSLTDRRLTSSLIPPSTQFWIRCVVLTRFFTPLSTLLSSLASILASRKCKVNFGLVVTASRSRSSTIARLPVSIAVSVAAVYTTRSPVARRDGCVMTTFFDAVIETNLFSSSINASAVAESI